MSNCSFQSQLVSIMEILAKTAVAEINRRVDDSCAVLRLEMSRSQRDIDVLKRKCQLMENELRKTRVRGKKKVFQSGSERFSHPVKIVLDKDKSSALWRAGDTLLEEDGPLTTVHVLDQPSDIQPRADTEESLLIKEERADEDVWCSDPQGETRLSGEAAGSFANSGERSSFELEQCGREGGEQPVPTEETVEHYTPSETPEEKGALSSPARLTEPPASDENGSELEFVVKDEQDEERDQSPAQVGFEESAGKAHGLEFMLDERDRQLWASVTDRSDPDCSYATEQYSQNLSIFSSHSDPPAPPSAMEDADKPAHSAGKAHVNMFSAALMKRQLRVWGEGGRQETLHLQQRQSASLRRDESSSQPPCRTAAECLTGPGAAFTGYSLSRTSYNVVKRMRSHWRSGPGERRFSCTFCGKCFMRFSQLKEHLRSHTGEKPYSCGQCGRSFTKQCNLIRHAVVHSGEKPYQCSLCGKCFTQRSSLKSHQRTHVGEGSLHMLPVCSTDPHAGLASQARTFI